MTFAQFWPRYVRAHRHPATRALHAVSSVVPFAFGAAAIVTGNIWWLVAIPFVAYGIAWFAHFFIERNKPETFNYALLSLRADYKMFLLTISGKMGEEIRKATGER
jgi:hypothetical protein